MSDNNLDSMPRYYQRERETFRAEPWDGTVEHFYKLRPGDDIRRGDYVVIDEFGSRRVMKPEDFHREFESADVATSADTAGQAG